MAYKEEGAGSSGSNGDRSESPATSERGTKLGAPADTTTPGATGMGTGAGGTPGSTIGGTTTSGSTSAGSGASDHTTGMGGGEGGATTRGLDSDITTGGGTTGFGGAPTAPPASDQLGDRDMRDTESSEADTTQP